MADIRIPDIHDLTTSDGSDSWLLQARKSLEDACLIWSAFAIGRVWERFPDMHAVSFEGGSLHPHACLTPPEPRYAPMTLAGRPELFEGAWDARLIERMHEADRIFEQWLDDERFEPLARALKARGPSPRSWLRSQDNLDMAEPGEPPRLVHARGLLAAIDRMDLWARSQAALLDSAAGPATHAKAPARM